ncbi:MAG: LCP family protein [Actinomycetota bacterium]|nr:LCP family protein [Actinomycetota bacterium]
MVNREQRALEREMPEDYVGYRTKRTLEKKKRKWKRWGWIGAVLLLLLLFVILGGVLRISPADVAWNKTGEAFSWVGRKIRSAWQSRGGEGIDEKDFLAKGKRSASFLVGVTKRSQHTAILSTLLLATYDADKKEGSVIYFPSILRVNVPGLGENEICNLVNLSGGEMDAALIATENLLGIDIDGYLLLTDGELNILLSKISPQYSVKVPSKMSFKDNSLDTEVKLKPGEQSISSRKLAAYLTYCSEGKELEQIDRQMDFAPQFLEKSREASREILSVTKDLVELAKTDSSSKKIAGLWKAFFSLPAEKFEQSKIPLKEHTFEKKTYYVINEKNIDDFEKKHLKIESSQINANRARVEILNGCGVPGIGFEVAKKLPLGEFYVVRSGNADNFNHLETVIVVYEGKASNVKKAEKIREKLEVGRVESRPRSTDLFDITIFVGRDYADK